MALTKTTASSAILVGDNSIAVTSATGFVANYILKVDEEFMRVASSYVSGTTIPVIRGQNGTVTLAHVTTANVVVGAGSDWADPNSTMIVAYPLSARRRKVISYSASGAITLPVTGEDVVAVLNGTSVLAMTVAVPTQDLDGARLTIIANGAAAHTVTFTGGMSGAGSAYDVITFNGTAPFGVEAMACNALWMSLASAPISGTVTAITGSIA